MLPIYEGLPEFFDYSVDLVKRKPFRDSLAIVTYHYLAEVVDAATHALQHYLTLTLTEQFLQNSHHGSPYIKWAYVNNGNFSRLDKNIKMLIPLIVDIYGETTILRGGSKTPYRWFDNVLNGYCSCLISLNEPVLALGSISFKNWFDGEKWMYTSPMAEPPVVTSYTVSIEDRTVLEEMQQDGCERVALMNASLSQLALWLQNNYTIIDGLVKSFESNL